MGRCLADNVEDNLGEDGYEEVDGGEDEYEDEAEDNENEDEYDADEDSDEDKDWDEEIWAQLLLAGSWCFSRSRHMYIHLDDCMSMAEIYSGLEVRGPYVP